MGLAVARADETLELARELESDGLPTPAAEAYLETARILVEDAITRRTGEAASLRKGALALLEARDREGAGRALERALRLDLWLATTGDRSHVEDAARELFHLGVVAEDPVFRPGLQTWYHRATSWYHRSLVAFDSLFLEGREHLVRWTARCAIQLGYRMHARGAFLIAERRWAQARDAILTASASRRSIDAELAWICSALATVLDRHGEPGRALELWLESAELYQAMIERGRWDLGDRFAEAAASAIRSIGHLPGGRTATRALRRVARLLDRPALAGRRAVPGLAAEAIESLAALLQRRGQVEEALGLHRLAIERSVEGGELVARAWRNLGFAHELQGEVDLAIRAHREALAHLEPRVASGHPAEAAGHVKSALRLLSIYRRANRPREEVEALARRCLALYRRLAPERPELPAGSRWALLEFCAECSRRDLRPDLVMEVSRLLLA